MSAGSGVRFPGNLLVVALLEGGGWKLHEINRSLPRDWEIITKSKTFESHSHEKSWPERIGSTSPLRQIQFTYAREILSILGLPPPSTFLPK